jgi:hypothetical protein
LISGTKHRTFYGMTENSSTLDRIKLVADRVSLAELAREAGVPYTTVHAFHRRGWKHKNLEVIDKLAAAADRITERDRDAAA